jgi:cytochrome c oxidase assembly factor CtaG
MADVLVLEFAAPNAVSIYRTVNKLLGWEGAPKQEDLPAGMITHVAGESGDKLVVVEVWESQAAQAEFMETQLGPAFAQANVPPPARVEWFAAVADGR